MFSQLDQSTMCLLCIGAVPHRPIHVACSWVATLLCRVNKQNLYTAMLRDTTHIAILQEETQEYLQQAKLKELVGRYSQFINFPIYLYASKEVDVPADEEEDQEAADTEADVSEDDVDDDGE